MRCPPRLARREARREDSRAFPAQVVAITALLDDDIQASLTSLTEKLTAEACDHCSLAYIPRDHFRQRVLPVWPAGDTVLLEMLADQAGVGVIPRSQTIWVGGIPEGDCTSAWLEKKFKRFGGIATISCRCKPAKDGKHKSWALISFWTELAALSASRDPHPPLHAGAHGGWRSGQQGEQRQQRRHGRLAASAGGSAPPGLTD